MKPGPGIKLGPHWWDSSALNTAPSLLPKNLSLTHQFDFNFPLSQIHYNHNNLLETKENTVKDYIANVESW